MSSFDHSGLTPGQIPALLDFLAKSGDGIKPEVAQYLRNCRPGWTGAMQEAQARATNAMAEAQMYARALSALDRNGLNAHPSPLAVKILEA